MGKSTRKKFKEIHQKVSLADKLGISGTTAVLNKAEAKDIEKEDRLASEADAREVTAQTERDRVQGIADAEKAEDDRRIGLGTSRSSTILSGEEDDDEGNLAKRTLLGA